MSKRIYTLAVLMIFLAGCAPMANGMSTISMEKEAFEQAPYTEAARAIRRDDAAGLRQLIGRGLDVNHETKEVSTAWGRDTVHLLLYAAASDSVNAARVLLEAGADVNKATKGGMTALIMGAPSPNEELFDLLLVRYKADPNKVMRVGVPQSALMFLLQERRALGDKRFDRAAKMIRYGADVNLDLGGGETAAISFSMLGDWRAVYWLLANGAHHETRDRFGTVMCYLRNSYRANVLDPSEAFTYRDQVRDWLLAKGVARSRVDPALHPSPKCDD
ncbi:MAG TPA: ankyrin repeat domain-containing protein [Macromonas sp.]|nr:ankyrin repeat domain-containing protein [Macromonas sp.]